MPGVIALDAMGSDRAPKPEVEGAIQAARRFGISAALVGPEETLRAEMARHPFAGSLPISIIHASEFITMEDKAVQAARAWCARDRLLPLSPPATPAPRCSPRKRPWAHCPASIVPHW